MLRPYLSGYMGTWVPRFSKVKKYRQFTYYFSIKERVYYDHKNTIFFKNIIIR
eukprot:SAG11_NODE_13_length_26388_cov_67.360341_29_plen_53_part_00